MAKEWPAPFDPADVKDYWRDWTPEMDATLDEVAQATFTLPQEALDATLQAFNVSPVDGKKAVVWFRATDAAALRAQLPGTTIEVAHKIVTAAGRTLNETLRLKIRA